MKTLNRTLSLVLVLVMVLGLFGVASAKYNDDATIQYKEAVDVVSAIGVIDGMGNNTFAPKGDLTREQAAKVICYLTMGKAAADKLVATKAPFTDVAADRWSAGSIAYAVQQGYISGRGDGSFDPTAKITGFEFAKLLLTALGYDATIEQFTGNSWAINVAKRAFQNGLFAGNDAFNGNAPATREEAALYVLNTLQAGLVTYDSKGTNITLPDGTTVNTGASAPKQISGTFMNSYYNSLKVNPGVDSFGRAANVWTLKGVEIGTYAKAGSVVVTEAQDADDLAKLLKGYSIKAGATYSVNGLNGVAINSGAVADANGNKAADSTTFAQLALLTGNGVKVEIYVANDNARLITGIAVIKTDLAQVKNVNTAAKSVTLAIVSAGGVSGTGTPYTIKAADNEALYESLKGLPIDTPVLATLNTANNGTSYSVASAAIPQVVTGKVTATSTDSGAVVKMTVNGTSYDVAAVKTAAVAGTTVNTKTDVTVLLDSYGYVVHVKGAAAGATHAYVLDTYQVLSNGRITNMAKIVLSDGTIADVAVGSVVTTGTTYKVDGTTPVYTFSTEATYTKTLSAAIRATDKTIGGNYFASDVKFVFINSTGKAATVKDGVQNVPTYGVSSTYILGAASATDPTLVVKAVYIVDGATAETSSIVYFKSGAANGSVTVKAADGTDVVLSTYDGYINGELVKKMPVAALPAGGIANNEFYTCIENANGSYSLSNAAYTGGAPAAVAKKNELVDTLAISKYATLSGPVTVDLSSAVFVDLRTLAAGEVKVDSLYALNTQLATKALTIDVLYNGANNTAAVVFVKSGVARTITIGTQPTGATVTAPATATLTVAATASNGAAVTYQWQSSADGTAFADIASATSASYTTPATVAGTIHYRCVVSAVGCASVNSNSVTVVAS